MRLKNILIVVKDIEVSKAFYQELFGLHVVKDFGRNVILTEGLVLQERDLWETFTKTQVTTGGNDAELYFEDYDIEAVAKKLEESSFEIRYVNRLKTEEWGQKVIRIYDPDDHVIEIGEMEKGSRLG